MKDFLLLAGGRVELAAAAGGDKRRPRFEMVAYTGAKMNVEEFGPVVVDLAGLKVPAGPIPALADHGDRLGGVVGHGVGRIEAGQLLVSGEISATTPAALQVAETARNGFPWQCSIGIQILKAVEIRAGQRMTVNGRDQVGPFLHVLQSKLKEVSFVVLGADSETSAKVAARAAARRKTMDPIEGTVAEELGATKERERLAAIRAACAGMDLHASPEKIGALQARAESGELSLDDLRERLLELLRTRSPSVGDGGGTPAHAAGDPMMVARASMLLRCGREEQAVKLLGAPAVEAARRSAPSMLDLAGMALQASGVSVGRFNRNKNELLTAAFSTASLQNLIGDTVRTLLLPGADELPPSWGGFVKELDLTDFKEHVAASLRGQFALEQVTAGGEFPHAALADRGASIKLETYAKMFRVSRQMIFNDAVGALADFATEFRRAASARRSKLLYTLLLANPDSHFKSDNANYIADVLAAPGLAAAIQALREMKNPDGEPLDIAPRVLLVGPALENTAKGLLATDIVANTDGTAGISNVNKGLLSLAVEPRIGAAAGYVGATDTLWFLLGGPADAPVLMGFLNGSRGPVVESFGLQAEAGTLGLSFRVYDDAGVALGHPEAAIMSTGAGA